MTKETLGFIGVGDMGGKTKRITEEETAQELWRQILLGAGA